MTTIRKVDHVAIAVASIAETVPLFCDTLQGEFIAGGDNDDTGIRLVHLRLPGFKLELMQPLRADSFLQRHLDERGPGFHHMTFFVDDLRTTVAALDAGGEPEDSLLLGSPVDPPGRGGRRRDHPPVPEPPVGPGQHR